MQKKLRKAEPRAPAIPPAALVFGAAGAALFIALAVMATLTGPPLDGHARSGLVLFGAVILSFLGGVHWGLTMVDPAPSRPRTTTWRYFFAILPSMIGWLGAALLATSAEWALSLLAVGFLLMLLHDVNAHHSSAVPPWYLRLRVPLTAAVVIALMLPAALGI